MIIGGTADFVWATMDLQMMMSGMQMFDMIGSGLIGGDMTAALQSAMSSGAVNDVYYGYFDFSDNNDFTGKAKTTGFAGKIGLTYKVSKRLTLGATYHSKVELDKFDGQANVNMAVSGDTGYLGGGSLSGTYTDAVFPLEGDITIKDFSWPAIFGGGIAFQANEQWFFAADLKRITWSDAMNSFNMVFKADTSPGNGAFAGLTLKATMPQNWDDQTVVQAGAAYHPTDSLTLRAGANLSDNPVPDSTVLYIFPAIVENHYMGGIGYEFNERQQFNFALSYAPKVSVTNSVTGIKTAHSQLSWQIMYSHLF
ncbi:MAG: OmpP1/FadL family transporter [Gammaproteobacteria bacterium]